MNQLYKNLLHLSDKPQTAEQVPEQAHQQHESEYIAYCIEQEQTVSRLEAALHESNDPKEIAMLTLRTACKFYDADWAGIIEVDLELGLASHGWWFNPDPKITTLQRMYEFENFNPMRTWIKSLKTNEPIIIEDVARVSVTSPQEYPVYQRLGVHSLLAVPFGPNPMGFLVLRNPSRYMPRVSTLFTLAYVVHRAMAQRNDMERTRMALSPDEIQSDRDIIINFFGSMEIITQDGIWREQDFNSPKCSRAAAYVMLHCKTAHSALAIADALSTEDTADVDTINKNIRVYMYRFRKSFDPISPHNLIEYTPNGYRLNPNLNVRTDLRQFKTLWELTRQEIPIPQKVHALKHAIKLYRGSVFASACDDHWLVGIATEYKMKYISMVNELLETFAHFADYSGIQHYAARAIKLTPENVKAHYWLIYAMYHSGAIAIARRELQQAEQLLTREEFASLKDYIRRDETLGRGQFMEEKTSV